MPLPAGTRFGPYEILAPLGVGGMGEVYRARDTKLNRDVALKILPAAFAADVDRMARFEREAQLLASLNHPHIAQIDGIEQNAIVMELVEGTDLAGPVPVDTAIQYARQIAAGLEAAHEKGIVHRDLKPANIKVTPEGVVKALPLCWADIRLPFIAQRMTEETCKPEDRIDGVKICALHKAPLQQQALTELATGVQAQDFTAWLCPVSGKSVIVPHF